MGVSELTPNTTTLRNERRCMWWCGEGGTRRRIKKNDFLRESQSKMVGLQWEVVVVVVLLYSLYAVLH